MCNTHFTIKLTQDNIHVHVIKFTKNTVVYTFTSISLYTGYTSIAMSVLTVYNDTTDNYICINIQ